jgi:cytoskeleton protein RodZ
VMGIVLLLVVGALAFWLWPAGWRLPSLAGISPGPDNNSGMVTTPLPVPAPAPAAEPASRLAQPGETPTGSSTVTEQVFPQPALPPVASAPAATPLPAPASAAAIAAPTASATAGQGPLQVRARQASWVEVVDARSQVLVSRTLAAGEAVEFDGALPLRVKIGNVGGTELTFRGRPVDLNAVARDNVARLELK